MRIIGLTGGIASGKTTVAELLERRGAAIVDADRLAREVVEPGHEAYQAIVAAFGPQILQADGTINRPALGGIIFSDPKARRTLEEITHPAIGKAARLRLAQLREKGVETAFYVAPLLIEAGISSRVDEIWVVYLDQETQLQRLMARDGIDRTQALMRIASQMPMEEKRRHARIVIDNSGGLASLEAQVQKLWEEELAPDPSPQKQTSR